MHATTIVLRAISCALLCAGGAAFASGQPLPEPVAEPMPQAVFAPAALPASASASSIGNDSMTAGDHDSAEASATASALDQARGGADVISNTANLSGVVSNNSATHVITGANIIQSNSFANASGIPVVIQNSGANVLIQNATVINLQLK